MTWYVLVLLVVFICFSLVVFFGAPYLPTLGRQIPKALELVDLQPGETLLELGCGDGVVLVAAAKRGWQVVGYELNPLLALVSWLRTRRYRKQVKVCWGNFWTAKWPKADGIFVFLLPKYMTKLDKKVMQSASGPVKLVSFAFTIPGKQTTKERGSVYLYEYK
jgi:hypothetical protein